ncbi:MAG: hypothetical protein KC431_28580, partial [Myxococcales bacterium]|nr:hypothetical protein [Myxococcales bacterium]
TGVTLFSTLGIHGYYAPPGLHLVDGYALADPLLARLPPIRRVEWKPGHLSRKIPEGYIETLAGDPWQVQIEDPAVAELYRTVALVHLAPIFAPGRAKAILALMSGRAAAAIDPRRYALAELVEIDERRLARRRSSLRFRDAGFELRLTPDSSEPLALALSPGQRYSLRFYVDQDLRERRVLDVPGEVGGPPATVTIPRPADADRLHVMPLTMHGQRSLELARGG